MNKLLVLLTVAAAVAVAVWACLSRRRLDPAAHRGWRRRVVAASALILATIFGDVPPAAAQEPPAGETLQLDHPLWQEVRTSWMEIDDLDASKSKDWEADWKERVARMKTRLDGLVAAHALPAPEAEVLRVLYEQAVFHRLRNTCGASCYEPMAPSVENEAEMDVRRRLCELQERAEKGEITREAADLVRRQLEQLVEFDARVRALGPWPQDPAQQEERQKKVRELDELWKKAQKGEAVPVDPARARAVAALLRILVEPPK